MIISIHEAAHIRYEKKKIKIDGMVSGTKYVNDLEGFWNKNHIKAFKKEFMARIEYSLLYKEEESTVSKDNWLDRYFELFELFQRFFVAPVESEERQVRSIKKKAKIDLAKKLGVDVELIKSSNISYDKNQDFTTFISEIDNHELGKKVCFKMYKKVVSNFENVSVSVKNDLSQKTLDK